MKKLATVIAVFAVLSLFVSNVFAAPTTVQDPIDGDTIPQFVQPLAGLDLNGTGVGVAVALGNRNLTLRMCEFRANILPPGAVEDYQGTWVWGYLVDNSGHSTCEQLIDQRSNHTGIIDTYTGPVIVNHRATANRPSSTNITFINDLGTTDSTNVLAYKNSVDQTIHWADPLADQTMANECMMKMEMKMYTDSNGLPVGYPPPGDPCAANYSGPIAAVPHLHGGEVPPQIDGGPDSWFTSDGAYHGLQYYSFAGAPSNGVLYKYPNTQEAGFIWFHDHTLGATRLNVFAGLAGAYLIEDPAIIPIGQTTTDGIPGKCRIGCLPFNLTPLAKSIPLVLQDRMFDEQGQLFYTADSVGDQYATNPEHPYWTPEFVGDTIVVNGKAWPYVNLEPKRYRFLLLNGSNARTYSLSVTGGNRQPKIWVIGSDGGYLDQPAGVTTLLMQPGERYDVIIDFAGFTPGTNLILNNTAPTPYPDGDDPVGTHLQQIVQFRIGACTSRRCGLTDFSYNPAFGLPLRWGQNAMVDLVNDRTGRLTVAPTKTRLVTLNEVLQDPSTVTNPVTGEQTDYPGGPLEILVNNTTWTGVDPSNMEPRSDFTPVEVGGVTTYFSEMPVEGTTELWEIVNMTMDAHPIHLHLVQFQIVNRQAYDTMQYMMDYGDAFPEGMYMPAYGPPLNVNGTDPLSAGKLGGNLDVDKVVNAVPVYLQGAPIAPGNYESGWKDTVVALPNTVTRIIVRWAPTSLSIFTPASQLYFPFDPNANNQYNYVWHCHIVDHEDNEMMRPDIVQLNPRAPTPSRRPMRAGINY